MKISKETIKVLQNFASISNNLRIYPGNELATISPQGSIFAKVTVADTFPVDVSIYELNSFLDLISYMENQEVEFGEKSLTISNNGSTFEYRYADPSVIIAPPQGKSIELTNNLYQFNLTTADIEMIRKAIGLTGAEHVTIESKSGQVSLKVGNDKRGLGQSKVLGTAAKDFKALLNVETFLVTADNYTVTLSEKEGKLFLHFLPTTTSTPQYWLALDPKSVA